MGLKVIRFALALALLADAPAARAQAPYLVKDISPGIDTTASTWTTAPVALGEWAYFAAIASAGPTAFIPRGFELWRTDGTEAGTEVVAGICQLRDEGALADLTVLGDALVFMRAGAGYACNTALFRSDGTAAGTVVVRDFGRDASYPGWWKGGVESTVAGGRLYLILDDGVHGEEVWVSDGTAAGTMLLKDVAAGPAGSTPQNLRPFRDGVCFSADDGVHGREPWCTDGSEAGTFMVRDINPGVAASLVEYDAGTTLGDLFVFAADDGEHGLELWRTNGTEAGTALVKDVNVGPGSSLSEWGNLLARLGSQLLFTATDGVSGERLWRTDGTEAGTASVTDLDPRCLGVVGQQAFFSADDGVHGVELWRTDGTEAGTTLVIDINPGSAPSSPCSFAELGGSVLFSVNDDGLEGAGMWRTDGTEAGTTRVVSLGFAPFLRGPAVNGLVYFWGQDDLHGSELWRTDGTAEGTHVLRDTALPACSAPEHLVDLDGTLFFVASDMAHGRALWRSDGTEAGTTMVKALVEGNVSAGVDSLTKAGGRLFFTKQEWTNGTDSPYLGLWTSDGTEPGTVALTDTVLGYRDSVYHSWSDPALTPVGHLVFFFAPGDGEAAALWRSDGTAAGTFRVRDVTPASTYPRLDALGEAALFFVTEGAESPALWRSDGTAAGTVSLRAFPAGPEDSAPSLLGAQPATATYFFSADDGVHGLELWRTDGTEAGTTLVKDISPGAPGSSPWHLVSHDDLSYFSADDGVHGRAVWRTDGTEAGTFMIADVRPGPDPSRGPWAGPLAVLDGRVFFGADDGVHGHELWVTDGTADGARLVKDLDTGGGSSLPRLLIALPEAGLLLFSAIEPEHGHELWVTDGSAEGTTLLHDFYPGPGSGSPANATVSGGRLFLTAYDPDVGLELYAMAVPPPRVESPATDCGCATTGGGAASWLALVVVVAAGARRAIGRWHRRR